jgi:hypothetical protein
VNWTVLEADPLSVITLTVNVCVPFDSPVKVVFPGKDAFPDKVKYA